MSLINEALKKAQRQRTGENPSLSSLPSVGGETPAKIAKRNTPGLNALLLRAGLGVGALAILVVAGVLFFRGKDTAAPAAIPAPVAVTPAPAPAPAAVAVAPVPVPAAPTSPAPAAPVPAPAPVQPAPVQASTFVVPNVTTSAPPAPVKTEPAQTVVPPVAPHIAAVAAPVAETPRLEPARPAAPPKLEPRAINFIEGIRVAGIRASATDSKVLMNDRVYRVGDTVEHEMGLKLVSITSSSLTFEDDRGAKYTRSF